MIVLDAYDQFVLADFSLFIGEVDRSDRDEMCEFARKDPYLNKLLYDLNSKYVNFWNARAYHDIVRMQLCAGVMIKILQEMRDYSVIPYYHARAKRMSKSHSASFTFKIGGEKENA